MENEVIETENQKKEALKLLKIAQQSCENFEKRNQELEVIFLSKSELVALK
jgi:hypothetical protein